MVPNHTKLHVFGINLPMSRVGEESGIDGIGAGGDFLSEITDETDSGIRSVESRRADLGIVLERRGEESVGSLVVFGLVERGVRMPLMDIHRHEIVVP